MSNLNIAINLKFEKETYSFLVKFYAKAEDEVLFTFGNASQSLERSSFLVLDEHNVELEPWVLKVKIPGSFPKTNKVITKRDPFEYKMRPLVEDDGKIVKLDFGSVTYGFIKGKKYKFVLRYQGSISNEVVHKF